MNGWDNRPNGWEKTTNKNKNINENEIKDRKRIEKRVNRLSEKIDLIICLAGGINEDTKEVHDFVKERLNLSYQYYTKCKCKILLMGGGTYHKPPVLNDEQYVIHESTACANYLLDFDIKPTDIYKEWSSYDTIANGYYAFSNYIHPMEFSSIMVITSQFHMDRTKAIFKYFNNLHYKNNNVKLFFHSTNNIITGEVLKQRIERENNSLISFKTNVIDKKKTLRDFLKWFYEEHNSYNVIGQYTQNNNTIKDGVKNSY